MNKHSDIIDVQIQDNKLVFSDQLINLMSLSVGDRIVIGYTEKDGNMIPIISKGEEGNKLTGKNTVSFKGRQQALLAQFGSRFWVTNNNGVFEMEGDGIPIYTEVKKAAQAYISKDIILDTNYDITKITNYEF